MKNLVPNISMNAGKPDDPIRREEGDVALQEAKPRLKRPSLYRVIMHNDDYTPMEFVVHVLQHHFGMSTESATHVMLTVHTAGKAVCGLFPKDIAETKAQQVNQFARENEHPLLCDVEVSDNGEGDNN